jgi:hypothetical protein
MIWPLRRMALTGRASNTSSAMSYYALSASPLSDEGAIAAAKQEEDKRPSMRDTSDKSSGEQYLIWNRDYKHQRLAGQAQVSRFKPWVIWWAPPVACSALAWVGSVGRLAGADEFHQAHDPTNRVGGGSRQGCRDHRERHPQGSALRGNRHAVGSKGAGGTGLA